jgi:cytochrome c oxidase assembly factor CtaG
VLGLSGGAVAEDPDGMDTSVGALRPIDRLALGRRRHRDPYRAVLFAGCFLAVMILWRTPLGVNGIVRHPWLVLLEAVTLTPAGVFLWLELVESLPLVPRLTRPHRIAMAAVCMWTIWVMAYLVGLSHGSWYTAFAHHAGGGLSVSADQQLTTGVIWLISGCAFVPLVFWNLFRWLQSEEDPDQALSHLVRIERTRGGAGDGRHPTPL